MKTRVLVLASLLLAWLGGCAGVSPELQRARSAEYRMDAVPAIMAAVRASLGEGDYDIAFENAERGVVVGAWRAYTAEGMAKRKDLPLVENGSVLFRLAIELGKGPRGGVVVHVVGHAQQIRAHMAQAQPLNPEDADRPPWVDARAENVAVAIHQKLAGSELASTP